MDIDDYKSLADSIIRLDDKELRSQVIEKGRERVKMFDAQMTADKHAELFR